MDWDDLASHPSSFLVILTERRWVPRGEIEHPEARYGFMTYYLSDPGRHELSSTHAANAHVALPYPRFVLHHVKQTDGVIRRVLPATSASVDDVSRR